MLIAPLLDISQDSMNYIFQTIFLASIAVIQSIMIDHFPKLTTKITDLSDYFIFITAVVLTASLLIFSPIKLDFSRLLTFTNFIGAEGSIWPRMEGKFLPFIMGLLMSIYTITGFDGSAHTAEEMHDAAKTVPKEIINAVVYSTIFGYVMVCTFVLVMPNLAEGVKQGLGFFDALMSSLPTGLRAILGITIFILNFLCGLACLISCSRMMFAFAQDGGLPASGFLRKIHPTLKTPVAAVWVSGALAVAATLYGDAFLYWLRAVQCFYTFLTPCQLRQAYWRRAKHGNIKVHLV